MRRLLLALTLLLATPGLAQEAPVPATPPPAMPAVPPTAPDPALPAPTTIHLTPKPGTLLEFVQTQRQSFDLQDAQIEPLPGQTLSPKAKANFEQGRADLIRAFKTGAQTAASGSKGFVKVLPNLPDGRQVIVYNTVIPDPRTKLSRSLRFRQTAGPDGRGSFEIDGPLDPADQQLAESLRAGLLEQSNSLTGALYNRPLTPGEAFEQSVSIDFQKLLGSLFAGLGAGAASARPANTPTRITVSYAYRGLNAAGLHLFDTTSQTDPVAIKVQLKGLSLEFNIQTLNGRGQTLVRPDGLLGGLTSHSEGEFEMVLVLQQERSQLRLKGRIVQDQTQTLRAATEGP